MLRCRRQRTTSGGPVTRHPLSSVCRRSAQQPWPHRLRRKRDFAWTAPRRSMVRPTRPSGPCVVYMYVPAARGWSLSKGTAPSDRHCHKKYGPLPNTFQTPNRDVSATAAAAFVTPLTCYDCRSPSSATASHPSSSPVCQG